LILLRSSVAHIYKNSSSTYVGVSHNKRDKKWATNIRIDGKQTRVGSFVEEKDAAKAYNDAVIKNGLNSSLNIL